MCLLLLNAEHQPSQCITVISALCMIHAFLPRYISRRAPRHFCLHRLCLWLAIQMLVVLEVFPHGVGLQGVHVVHTLHHSLEEVLATNPRRTRQKPLHVFLCQMKSPIFIHFTNKHHVIQMMLLSVHHCVLLLVRR